MVTGFGSVSDGFYHGQPMGPIPRTRVIKHSQIHTHSYGRAKKKTKRNS